MDAIRERISVRSYADRPIDDLVREKLERFCRTIDSGPFESAVRFQVLNLDCVDPAELRRLGTYGVIRGARVYILGIVKDGSRSFEDFGYCMEKIILKATALGLSTCWLAGTFKRSAFASQVNLEKDELLPAITPVGYPVGKLSAIDRMFRIGAGSTKRKPWSDLFFASDGVTPLSEAGAGEYSEVLDAVRMGPSASNRQPWRIINSENGVFHLFLKENKLYNSFLGKIRVQNIDMGIAMCHFELAARERFLPGRWKVDGPAVHWPGLQYIATWSVR